MSLVKYKCISKLSKLGYIQQLKVLFFSGRVQVFMMKRIERENIKVGSQFANYIGSARSD